MGVGGGACASPQIPNAPRFPPPHHENHAQYEINRQMKTCAPPTKSKPPPHCPLPPHTGRNPTHHWLLHRTTCTPLFLNNEKSVWNNVQCTCVPRFLWQSWCVLKICLHCASFVWYHYGKSSAVLNKCHGCVEKKERKKQITTHTQKECCAQRIPGHFLTAWICLLNIRFLCKMTATKIPWLA